MSSPEVKWTLNTEEASHKTWAVAVLDDFATAVAARTANKFKIRVTTAGEMGVKREDIPLLLSQGSQMQMAFLAHGHIAGTIPHLAIFSLPFLVGGKEGIVKDARRVEAAVKDMSDREFKKLNLAVAFTYHGNATQLISKESITDVSDMKGLKVRAWDESTSNIVKALNGVPVVMPIAETYTAIQRGVVSGVLTGPDSGMVPMALHEVAKNLYLVDLAPAFIYVGYNINAFNTLPADYQKILREEWANAQVAAEKARAGAIEPALKTMRDAGVQIIQPSADQMTQVKTKVKPQWAEWAARGPTQKEALDLVMKAFGY